MRKISTLCMGLCLVLMIGACTSAALEPSYTPLLEMAAEPENVSSVQKDVVILEEASPEWVDPGYESTPTPPPLPTSLPTPATKPLPVVDLSEVTFAPKTTGSFWIYYWQDNEVWRVDEQGDHAEMLLDTQKEWGQWLTAVPEQLVGTECCFTGPRVIVSPDEQKLAVIVLNKVQLESKDDPFAFSIYVYEIGSGQSYLIGEGSLPKWSPDSQQLAYAAAGGLWVADAQGKETQQIVAPDTVAHYQIAELAWLPSGTQITYLYSEGHHYVSTLWLVDVVGEMPPRQLVNLDYSIYQITPSLDGSTILFLSAQGSQDWSQYHLAQNLWSITLDSGQLTQITQDMVIDIYAMSPDGQWLLLSGYRLYERAEETYDRDLWLMNRSQDNLYRLTTDYGLIWAAGWSPDGSRPLAWDGGTLFSITSSDRSLWQAMASNTSKNFAIGGAK